MTSVAGGYSRNLTNSLNFRRMVVLLLRLSGFEVRAKSKRTHHSNDADRPAGDVWGLSGWTVLTRNELTLDLAGGTRAAREAAAQDRNDKWAMVWAKKASPPEESYVVLDFETFTKVLQQEQERTQS